MRSGTTLAIDFGTTYTRGCLYERPSGKEYHVIDGAKGRPGHGIGSQRREISSFCTLFAPKGKQDVGAKVLARPDRVSLKAMLIILGSRNDEWKQFKRVPQGHRLKKWEANGRLMKEGEKQIRRMLRRHFTNVARRARATVEDNKLAKIDTIAWCLPNWANEGNISKTLLEHYREVWAEVLENRFFDVCESQALMHGLMSIHSRKLQSTLGNRSQLVHIDFGGSSMNGCRVAVEWGSPEKRNTEATIFVTGSFGALGGSEQLLDLILQGIRRKLKEAEKGPKDGEPELENLMAQFFTHVHMHPDCLDPDNAGHINPASCCWSVEFTKDEMEHLFLHVFGPALDKVEKALADVAVFQNDFAIIVSGGSAKNQYLRKKLEDIVEKTREKLMRTNAENNTGDHAENNAGDDAENNVKDDAESNAGGDAESNAEDDAESSTEDGAEGDAKNLATAILPILYIDKIDLEDQVTLIARGAARCASHRLSVAEFIDRGAGFGLQIRDVKWESTALFLNGKERFKGRIATWHATKARATEKRRCFRIVCEPFYASRRFCELENGGDSSSYIPLDINRCYDVYTQSTMRSLNEVGAHHFQLEIEEAHKGVVFLQLVHYFANAASIAAGQAVKTTYMMSLRFDCGTGTALHNEDSVKVSSYSVVVDFPPKEQPRSEGSRPTVYGPCMSGPDSHPKRKFDVFRGPDEEPIGEVDVSRSTDPTASATRVLEEINDRMRDLSRHQPSPTQHKRRRLTPSNGNGEEQTSEYASARTGPSTSMRPPPPMRIPTPSETPTGTPARSRGNTPRRVQHQVGFKPANRPPRGNSYSGSKSNSA